MGGVSLTVRMLYVGATCALPLAASFPPSPKEVLASIQHSKNTILSTVPLFLEQLIPLLYQDDNIGFQMLARLKFVSSGGASCPPDVCNQLTERGVNLVMVYGSTETGFLLASEYTKTDKNQWQRLRPMLARQPNMKFLPIEPNSNILELFILPTDPFLAPDFAKNGLYSPGDLFLEESPGSGYYLIQGRKDDVLVHVTGEKTNALPMELVLRQHRIVENAVVLGHNRLCCAALIQLNIEEAFKYELREIEEQVLIAVKAAHKDAPSHSQIAPSLVKILPMSKRLPVTAKGNVIRKLADLEYKDVIEQMYEQFFNKPKTDSDIQHPCQQHSWTRDSICNYLKSTVARVLDKPVEIFADYSKSLHSLSLNSLTAVELRNTLCLEFGQLAQNIVFEFPSIDALADELLRITNKQQVQTSNDPLHYKETEEIIDKYINLMKAHKDQMTMASEKISNDLDSNASSKRVVLITGANGSLGSQIMLHLLKKPQVKRVYCLLRGDDATDRLRRAMQARKQDSTVLLDTKRVVILSMDLNDEKLGQTAALYDQLQHEVTDIIHSAWKMDFNMTIKDFDRECLQGLYHLLKLASSTSTQSPMRFHFISSISSAGSGLIGEIKEEPLPRRTELSLAQGYGQSKYAGEHMCWAAMDLWGVPVDIYRFGQIAGDSETGVWNTNEMISLIICAGGGELGALPEDRQRVDWIPVNYGAASVADIAIDATTRAAPPAERVHHILNPHTISWSQLLEQLKSSGLQFTVVPIKDWLNIVLASPKNPAYALAGFFEKIFAEGKKVELAKYSTEKSVRRTTALEFCPPIDQKLVQRYLDYWSEVGFLKHGYKSTA